MKFTETFKRILCTRAIDVAFLFSDTLETRVNETIPCYDEAVRFFSECVNSKVKIGIVSDYDCDGITAASQFCIVLKKFGVDFSVFFPDRHTEGYGLNERMIHIAHASKIELLICVDLGVSSIDCLQLAKKLGLKTIVIDHHRSDKLSPDIVIDHLILTSQLGSSEVKPLCASGLTFFFLRDFLANTNAFSELADELLELATVGTLCDMVPLVGLNRPLVKNGLRKLSNPINLGLRALMEIEGKSSLSQKDISFSIGPKINACGRLGDPALGVEILVCEDYRTAIELASQLSEINEKRKRLQKKGVEIALNKIKNSTTAPVIFHDEFELGVIGLIAQALVERFNLPSAVVARDLRGSLKGSARSPKHVDCFEALSHCQEVFAKYGGHRQAGGFSLKNSNLLPVFQKKWSEYCEGVLPNENIEYDCEIVPGDISHELVREINLLEPFGIGNSRPRFLFKDCSLINFKDNGNFGWGTLMFQSRNYRFFCYEAKLLDKIKRLKLANLVASIEEKEKYDFREIILNIKGIL
ncbi:MAG: DHHA1 domain-containing protein [Deltaproteobacteria bacterium]|nr:DHHA1 domain-containing protein [Deltaproteobacteria bacterium]